jgi:hypothetical protein
MSRAFARFAGFASIFVGIGGLVYGILFAYIVAGAPRLVGQLWFLLLMVGGLFSLVVVAALYRALREADGGFALVALLLGLLAATGGLLHGAYNLGDVIGPPIGRLPPHPETVSSGILRYGVQGLFLLQVGWLLRRSPRFPGGLAAVAGFGGVLLVVVYLGRLFDFITPATTISLLPPLLYGLVVHPTFYVWLGLALRRAAAGERASVEASR